MAEKRETFKGVAVKRKRSRWERDLSILVQSTILMRTVSTTPCINSP